MPTGELPTDTSKTLRQEFRRNVGANDQLGGVPSRELYGHPALDPTVRMDPRLDDVRIGKVGGEVRECPRW